MPSDYESQSIKTDTQAERIQREEEVKEEAEKLKERAAAKKESAKEKAKKNADNPVVIGNAVGLAIVGGIVGFGAYRQYARGELTGKVVAAWAAAIGLFGVGDYYVSQYVLSLALCVCGKSHLLNLKQVFLQEKPAAINAGYNLRPKPYSIRLKYHCNVEFGTVASLSRL